jgi:hypothetical protein
VGFAILSWSFGLFAEPVTPLLFFIFVVLFHVAKPSVVFSGFASTAWWLVSGGSVTAVAVQVTGLGRRLADLLFGRFGTSYPRAVTAVALAAVGKSGLDGIFDAVFSIEAVGIYKPNPKVYQLAPDRFALPATAICFQSSNGCVFGRGLRHARRVVQPLRPDAGAAPGKPDREITSLAAARSARRLSCALNRRN